MSDITPPPPPPPGAPQPPMGGAAPTKNWMGITGLVLSIVGILLACCWGVGLLFGGGGAVLGFLGKKAAETGEATNRGLSQAAFITGIVAAGLSVVGLILSIIGLSAADWTTY